LGLDLAIERVAWAGPFSSSSASFNLNGIRTKLRAIWRSINSFEEGATVFKDRNALLLDDPDQFDDEVRFELLGYSTDSRLLVVVHVERGVRLRIVSVLPPTKPERILYEERGKS
jgi:uncharacterized DUF497 family protein